MEYIRFKTTSGSKVTTNIETLVSVKRSLKGGWIVSKFDEYEIDDKTYEFVNSRLEAYKLKLKRIREYGRRREETSYRVGY